MSANRRFTEGLALRPLAAADAIGNRLYGHRFNPLYQSGTIVVALFVVIAITGLWLLLFYRVGAPWESVARLTADRWTGNWVRTLHRYATDLAVAAVAVHAVRMFAQGRSRGARTHAWVSGCVLLLFLLLCGWTGYVMVWDTFGQLLAREGARMVDALPFLSEPTSRAFTGEQPVPTVFFFLNLFAHIGIPLAMGVAFWLHVRRLQRPAILPPRPLTWGITGVLAAAAIAWPLAMAPKADPFVLPAAVPADWLFAFWIPVARPFSGGQALALAVFTGIALLVLPWLEPGRAAAPTPSSVDETLCVGCLQCAIDCPYGAIAMIERESRRSELVARVDPDLCVSCGICAGSCSPMGVGPPGRTGRDQMTAARELLARPGRRGGEIVVIGCEHGAGGQPSVVSAAGAVLFPIDCGGNLHTSVIELLLRDGAVGVMILACPPRDCRHREGVMWLDARVHHDREAELQARVDRARVRIVHAGAAERSRAVDALRVFAADLASLQPAAARVPVAIERVCEPTVATSER